jgi:hypothetical protein
VTFDFTGPIWFWKGPAPWYFVTVPAEQSQAIKAVAGLVTYGWGVIPAHVQIGGTTWSTSLIPKDGLYLVPIKKPIRLVEQLNEGDVVNIQLEIGQ